MSRFKITLTTLAVIACALVGAPSMATTWDLAADFSSTASTNGDWSYGYTLTADNFMTNSNYALQLYQTKTTMPALGWNSLTHGITWYTLDGYYGYASLSYNNGDAQTWSPYANIPANTVWAFPGRTNTAASVARWTAAVGGTYNISAVFNDISLSTLRCSDVHVIVNRANHVLDGNIDATHLSYSYGGQLTLAAGDTVDFMVAKHAANEPWYSAVAIGATITSVDVPEPGSMFALSAGALGLLGLIRRKKS